MLTKNKLIEYVKDLLRANRSICVPGMGTFALEETAAQIKREGATIIPPSAKLRYYRNLDIDTDGLLIDYITEQELSNEGDVRG